MWLSHPSPTKCPAQGHICYICSGYNHYTALCQCKKTLRLSCPRKGRLPRESQDVALIAGKDPAILPTGVHAATHLAIASPAVPPTVLPTVLPLTGLTVLIASVPPSNTTRIALKSSLPNQQQTALRPLHIWKKIPCWRREHQMVRYPSTLAKNGTKARLSRSTLGLR